MPLSLDKTVYGMSLPGTQNEHGNYAVSQDGLVLSFDSLDQTLTAGIIHNDASSPESAAVSNLETVSAAYDLSKLRQPSLTEMVFRMNNRVAPLEKDLGASFPQASLMRLSPLGTRDMYELEVASNGAFRCMVLDPATGKFETNTPNDTQYIHEYLETLYDRPIAEVLHTMIESAPSDSDTTLLTRMLENFDSGKFTEDQMRQIFRNFIIEPAKTTLNAAAGEVVLMVPETAIQEFGGPEEFAQYFSTLIHRNGQSLENVCKGLLGALKKVMNGEEANVKGTEKFDDVVRDVYPGEVDAVKGTQADSVERKLLLDQSMSIIAFEVPKSLDK